MRKYLWCILILVISVNGKIYAVDRVETFDGIANAPDGHHAGAFTGSSGVAWTYYGRNVTANYLNGVALTLGDNAAFLEGVVDNGIEFLEFDMKRGWTLNGGQLTLSINDELIYTTDPVPSDGAVFHVSVPIRTVGKVKIRIGHTGSAVVIDNLKWSSYGSSFYFSGVTLNPENIQEFILVSSEELTAPESLSGISFMKNSEPLTVQSFRVDKNKLIVDFGEPVGYSLETYQIKFEPSISNIKNMNDDILVNQPELNRVTYAFDLLPGATTNTVAQPWRTVNDVIDGWDWSLPDDTRASEKGSVLGSIDMPCTQVKSLNFSWKQLEPQEGIFNFQLIKDKLDEFKTQGVKCQVHIRASVIKTNYYYSNGDTIVQEGTAPDWLMNYSIGKKWWSRHNEVYPNFQIYNYEIYDSGYTSRFNNFLKELCKSGVLNNELVDGIYMHGVSGTRGEEVDEYNLNPEETAAWKSMIQTWKQGLGNDIGKLAYPGRDVDWLNYAFSQGLGQRGGFIEMYLRDAENPALGCSLDENGYLLFNDEIAPVKEGRVWDDENEEYGDGWEGRFGHPANYPHRFRESWLRALQMRRRCLWTGPHTYYPEFSYWCGMQLGRKANDSPDAWSYLKESYLQNKKSMKNTERWVFQRDLPEFPTVAVYRFDHGYNAVNVDPNRKFDLMGRRGKKFGFGIDDNFIAPGSKTSVAIKLTYMDKGSGSLSLKYTKEGNEMIENIDLTNTGLLKTATFFVSDVSFNAEGYNPDFYVDGNGYDVEVFMLRVIKKDHVTAVRQIEKHSSRLAIFPNPAKSHISVTGISHNDIISIYSINGHKIKTNVGGTRIDISQLNPGLYVVTTGKGDSVKFIVQK